MSGGTEVSYGELLAAGGVLPPDTEDAHEEAVPLTARTYRHPALDDRVVVRLVAGELGAAEDLAAGFLGLEQDAEPAVVGLGMRQALGFPEWVLVHHPEDGHHALGVVPDLEKALRQVKSKPKAALEACLEIGARLGTAVPHFLPTYYEQAGRAFLAEENAAYASQLFTRARKAEAEHGLGVDEERLDAVFLEFALAGALPVKTLSSYAKELASRLPADEALERFTRLCLRRTAGGLPPSAQMANDLRRLARAAGQDASRVEQDYLAALLGLPATLRAPVGWWKGHRGALVALAAREPSVRGVLLNTIPASHDREMPALWLAFLQESGAAAALWDGSLPADQRPQDGTAGWLERFVRFRERTLSWRDTLRMPELYALVERSADRLRAELAEAGRGLRLGQDVDLLDLGLSLGLPVADPEGRALSLVQWGRGEGQRDLVSLAADPRFHRPFAQGCDQFHDNEEGLRTIRLLAASPGGRPLLTDWVREVVRRFAAVGLPQLPDALARLRWLPAEALALAEDEVRAAVATDLAPVLARTLRTGLFDELGWPAWEEATAELTGQQAVQNLLVSEAWPHLVVAGVQQARVIGAEGTVLAHDLRVPRQDMWGDPGFHHVDGELLVYWNERSGGMRGYWHTRPDAPQTITSAAGRTRGTEMNWYGGDLPLSLPLPGGGRTTGGGVLHAGDTRLPAERRLYSDGDSYWVWHAEGEDRTTHGVFEYDPATGGRGRRILPPFLADALRDAPAGSTFGDGRLLPSPVPTATCGAAPVDGLIGLRRVKLPTGGWLVEDLAGNRVTVPTGRGVPAALVTFPGADRPRAVLRDRWELVVVDEDGVVTSEARSDHTPGAFAQGSALLPPVQFWAFLTPRDPAGSEALRRVDRDTAAALLATAAGAEETRLAGAIRALLPVTHDALVAGIAGVARYAAAQQSVLDSAAERLTRALDGALDEGPAGPADEVLAEATNGLGANSRNWWHGDDRSDATFRTLRTMAAAAGLGGDVPEDRSGRLHLDGPALPDGHPGVESLVARSSAVAYRAACGFTAEKHREALVALLERFAALGLEASASAPWRRVTVRLAPEVLRTPAGTWREGAWGGLLPLGGGAFLAALDRYSLDHRGGVFTGFLHDPERRFEMPEPYILEGVSPLGEGETGLLGAFLAELAVRGPAPWFPEAADEFARLTGVTDTMARLVVAGLPNIDTWQRTFLSSEQRAVLGVKTAPAAVAKDELRAVGRETRAAVVGALLPADPARLWTDGPDVAAAAEVWNARVGRRAAVPEELLGDAMRAIKHAAWDVREALPALLNPADEPRLTRDLEWAVTGDRVRPVGENPVGFTADILLSTTRLLLWLSHRLPAGDPVRAALPPALTAVRQRLAHPGLVLDLGRYVSLPAFRRTAGAPTETGPGFERYGAVIMATHDDQPAPGIRVALLDEAGQDPYLPVLRADAQHPDTAEVALRLARDPQVAALLADPGEPVAGERGKDGTWWPQDPGRSVPDLVTSVAKEYGISEDAATVYLMLLAMPDPTDRMTARWTGWKPARLKAARAELAAHGNLVVEATRTRAGRSLFLPGGWHDPKSPRVPLELWKLPLYGEVVSGDHTPFGVIVPTRPAAELYRAAWQRVQDGDVPRFEELKVRRGRRR